MYLELVCSSDTAGESVCMVCCCYQNMNTYWARSDTKTQHKSDQEHYVSQPLVDNHVCISSQSLIIELSEEDNDMVIISSMKCVLT